MIDYSEDRIRKDLTIDWNYQGIIGEEVERYLDEVYSSITATNKKKFQSKWKAVYYELKSYENRLQEIVSIMQESGVDYYEEADRLERIAEFQNTTVYAIIKHRRYAETSEHFSTLIKSVIGDKFDFEEIVKNIYDVSKDNISITNKYQLVYDALMKIINDPE